MKSISATCLILLQISLFAQEQVTVFLIGDAGAPRFPTDPNLEYLKELTSRAGENDVLIFLGDNIYPSGLPSREDPEREVMEAKLVESLKILKAFPGRALIIPGNHDWAAGGKEGWTKLLHMQDFVDGYMGKETVFLPRGGCPGPVEITLNTQITLIILDTQYFLHRWDKPDQEDGCDAKSSADAIMLLDDMLSRNADKHVIVAGHHPMYSFGPHGSTFTFKQHLFPLTDVNKKLWIPLPVIGSIYPVFRSVFGSIQDLSNPKYKLIRNTIVKSFRKVPHLVYISGHEHSLQYIKRDSAHYIVSGSGSKSSSAAAGIGTEFAAMEHGFAQLTYLVDGRVNLNFYDGDRQKMLFNEQIYQKLVEFDSLEKFETDYTDSTVIEPISLQYFADDARKYWLGENYRHIWATPVKMRVFNIGKEQGGLHITRLGGGNQTKSLKLEDDQGRGYSLRSLDKYPERLLPAQLYHTLAAEILQDQISAANPHGAFAVPPMANALGIYHTNPELVYIPDDPRLGDYQSLFANMVAMFEENPNDEWAGAPLFGNGVEIESTPEMVEKLEEDNDETVDQPLALRNRLFDMIIGDWDRHEDQWEWTALPKEGKGHIWQPIPKDRDQAFFVSDGLFGWLASRKFALPNTEGFDEHMDYPPGFNTSGRFFDRSFLTSLSWGQWEDEIAFIQEHLTDSVIENALKVWPDTIYNRVGKETAQILKARRDDMLRFARIHYEFISREVQIPGSDKHEHFLVERLNDRETRVTVRKLKKDEGLQQIIFQRTFLTGETDEIRLFGLGGEDIFEVQGKVSKGIKVRIIGGEGEDKITDRSHVSGLGRKTVVYDLKQNTELFESRETNEELGNRISVNRYVRNYFRYNQLLPLLSAQYNPDDGLFLGAGFLHTRQAWRKQPYSSRHKMAANVAFATGAYNLIYNGDFTDILGKWDFGLDLAFQKPVTNYFGLGNESEFDFRGNGPADSFEDPIDFYRVSYRESRNYLNLAFNLGERGRFRLGPEYLQIDLKKEDNKFITQNGEVDQQAVFDPFRFLGIRTEIETDTRDNSGIPARGVYAKFGYGRYFGLHSSEEFTRFGGEFRFFLSTQTPSRFTFANRIGMDRTLGNLQFFNGAVIGRETIRGYRRNRFIGNTSFYHNTELRFQLATFRTYLLPITTGLLVFHDIGRVWLDEENSGEWHSGKGFGVWLAPLNKFALVFSVAFSEEETLPSLSFGYHF